MTSLLIAHPTFFLALSVLGLLFAARVIVGKPARSLVYIGTHTEYAGGGRVRFVAVFGGAGCCIPLVRGCGRDGKPLESWHWPNLSLRGFTIYVRTAPTSHPSSWGARRFRRFALSTNPNNLNLFGC